MVSHREGRRWHPPGSGVCGKSPPFTALQCSVPFKPVFFDIDKNSVLTMVQGYSIFSGEELPLFGLGLQTCFVGHSLRHCGVPLRSVSFRSSCKYFFCAFSLYKWSYDKAQGCEFTKHWDWPKRYKSGDSSREGNVLLFGVFILFENSWVLHKKIEMGWRMPSPCLFSLEKKEGVY